MAPFRSRTSGNACWPRVPPPPHPPGEGTAGAGRPVRGDETMTYRTSRVAPLVLLLLPGWSRAAAQGPAAPVGQMPKEAPGDAAADDGPPAQAANPLGAVPPDDPGLESYSHANCLRCRVDILWARAFLAIL